MSRANIELFLQSTAFAVVGASTDRNKFGNRILRCYQTHQKLVYPVHPREEEIEGLRCYPSIAELPAGVASISLITPPAVSELVVEQAHAYGIKNIWLQPGAESQLAIQRCHDYGINVIADGSCILVELGCSH